MTLMRKVVDAAKEANLQPKPPPISYNEQIAQLKALEIGFD